jgi:hypothetical protein
MDPQNRPEWPQMLIVGHDLIPIQMHTLAERHGL